MTVLVALDPGACPDCGLPVQVTAAGQLPLLRHGGYGATRRTSWRWCPCGYLLTHEVTEVRPVCGPV
jgi:hypothetical protein